MRTSIIVALILSNAVSTRATQTLRHVDEPSSIDLRSAFDHYLGEAQVQEFISQLWGRSVTEFFGTPRYKLDPRTKPKKGKTPGFETDLTFNHDHHRFDALGSVLQCPPAIFTSYGAGDAEKHVCGLPSVASHEEKHTDVGKSQHCVIISIGGANDWGFEEAIGAALPHCKIHTFDCTVDGVVPRSLKGQASFHKICLGTKDEVIQLDSGTGYIQGLKEMRMMSWGSMMHYVNIAAPPEVLKLDIEGFEWSVLQDLASHSPRHLLPKSISLELHYQTQMSSLEWYQRFRSPYELGAFMDHMFTRGGYVLVDRNDNSRCKHCSEIVIARLAHGHHSGIRSPSSASA